MINKIRKLAGHLSIIFAVLFITFQILDNFNPMQEYLKTAVNIGLLYIFCAVSLLNGIFQIWRNK